MWRGSFEGEEAGPDMSGGLYSRSNSADGRTASVDADWCVLDQVTLVQTGEYDWTVREWRHYGLMSNYFDSLLLKRTDLSDTCKNAALVLYIGY